MPDQEQFGCPVLEVRGQQGRWCCWPGRQAAPGGAVGSGSRPRCWVMGVCCGSHAGAASPPGSTAARQDMPG